MNCKIKTITKQKEYPVASIFGAIAPELDMTLTDDIDADTIETYMQGELIENADDISVIYEEIISDQNDACDTVISFKSAHPSEVLLTKKGAVNTVMQFIPGDRTICVYETPFMPFEICVYTKSVDNKLLEFGYIEIVYLIEIKGASAQKTVFRMEIEKI